MAARMEGTMGALKGDIKNVGKGDYCRALERVNRAARARFFLSYLVIATIRRSLICQSGRTVPHGPVIPVHEAVLVFSSSQPEHSRRGLLTPATHMSNSRPITTASSSSNFQLIFNNALKAYEKRTKKDLLAHPLAAKLQNCNSPRNILDVLHQQVQGLDQSQSSDDRWTKWLDPTVNVLYIISKLFKFS